jgi:hypothetical protein
MALLSCERQLVVVHEILCQTFTDQETVKSVARLVRDTISWRNGASVYLLQHVYFRHLQQIDLLNPYIAFHWFE